MPDARQITLRQAFAQPAALTLIVGGPAPDALAGAALAELWQWAQAHWSIATVPRCRQAVASDFS